MAFKHAIEELQAGRMVTIKPKGHSMEPLIKSGQSVLLVPFGSHHLSKLLPEVGDVVLCKVKGSVYLHKIVATSTNKTDTLYQIANNKGRVNGWTSSNKIYGLAKL
jgi:hypothetical protein